MVTMNIFLPDPMKNWVETQSGSGKYSNSSDYVRGLILKDQIKSEKITHMQKLVTEGLESGITKSTAAEILNEARA